MSSSLPELRIGGLAPLSSCDWPGQLVATVFCQGCPWRCRYCHNAGLQEGDAADRINWADALALFLKRRGLLDGVVFSGGEPTAQHALPAAIRDVRALGLRVGLHTAGPYPDRLAAVLPLLDWIGFDAKAPFARYAAITGVPDSGTRARESLKLVLASGKDHEVRTTVHPALLDEAALADLAADLEQLSVEHYAVQQFRPTGCRDAALNRVTAAPMLPPGVREMFADFSER